MCLPRSRESWVGPVVQALNAHDKESERYHQAVGNRQDCSLCQSNMVRSMF